MLGDQLIKNERIALVELVKNAYDADASWAKITFVNFSGDDYVATADSRIVVEDDGFGMTADVLKKHWATPATPMKIVAKNAREGETRKGRKIQGEKGDAPSGISDLDRDS
jgi:HSP90 family molecular chaperone